jgi:hypothetical protein
VSRGEARAPRPAVALAGAPRLPAAAARQNIASYAHRHGAVLTRAGQPVRAIAAAALCRVLRQAVERSDGARRERVETLVRAIALALGRQTGPLAVPQQAFDALRRLARRRR